MGIRMPGISGMFDPKIIDALIQAEKVPVEQAKHRKENVVNEKKEVDKLQGLLGELDSSLNSLKTYGDFAKMKVDSSHPDILDGIVKSTAMEGSYEFEVRGLAKTDKELAYGFPDKDKTDIGFGYMLIEREDKEPFEVTIDPGSTLQDVATKINDASAGVKAMVINTNYQPDPYRLLVISEKSGKEARVILDADTTFLEFKEQVVGRNLDVLFEDVPVTSDENTLKELVDGVVFNVHRAEPGTRVEVNITHDIDKTLESIKHFVEKYNAVAEFVNKQYIKDPNTGKAGILAGDGTTKTVMRSLQGALIGMPAPGSKYSTLADIGITTNPKTGTLDMNDGKVKSALAEDYQGVSQLFIRSKNFAGVADRIAAQLANFRDPQSGVVRSRVRGLENVIQNQDKDIARREQQMTSKEESIRRRFSALDSQLSGLKGQGDFLAQRFGGGGGGGGAGGGGG